jgi:hypothetical protein
MSWDANAPVATEQWNVGDGKIRANNLYLQTFLREVSTFVFDPDDPLVAASIRFKTGTSATPPVTLAPEQTGVVYFDTTLQKLWINTNGFDNTWVQISAFAALTIAGALLAQSTLTVTGAAVLNATLAVAGLASLNAGVAIAGGDATLATTRKLVVPTGESWLRQNSVDINPHAHAARHQPGSTNGAWVTPNDVLPFAIQQVRHSATLLGGTTISETVIASQTFGSAGDAKCSITINTTGRPGVSRGILYAEFGATKSSSSSKDLDVAAYRANAGGTVGAVGTQIGPTVPARWISDEGNFRFHGSFLKFIENLPVHASNQFALHALTDDDTNVVADYVSLIYVDLGVV